MRTALLVLLILFCAGKAMAPSSVRTARRVTAKHWEVLPDDMETSLALMRDVAVLRYDQIRASLAETAAAHRRRNVSTASQVFAFVAMFGWLLLLVPILRWRRHRGRRRVLVATSVFAALLFALGATLLGGLFELTNQASQTVAENLDPKAAMLEAGFNLALDETHAMVWEGQAPWMRVYAGSDDEALAEPAPPSAGFVEQLFLNLATMYQYAFEPAAMLFHVWNAAATFLPMVLIVATALLFLLSVRPLLVSLVTLPTRSASGEPRAVRRAMGMLAGTFVRELLAILALLAMVVLLGAAIGVAMRVLAAPAVRILVDQTEAAVRWLGEAQAAKDLNVTLAVCSLPAVLLLVIGLMAASSVLWMFHARRVLRARFHDGVSLRAHDGFWRRATWALVQAHWVPVVFLTLIAPVVRHAVGGAGGADTPDRLALSAALLLGGFALACWFFRVPRALRTLWRGARRDPAATPGQVDAFGPAATPPA